MALRFGIFAWDGEDDAPLPTRSARAAYMALVGLPCLRWFADMAKFCCF